MAPCTKVTFLGVEVDICRRLVSIPTEKLCHISQLGDAWASKRVCTKCELQSLLGNLLYVHKCVRPARVFLNRMLELLRSSYDVNIISLTEDFR